MWSQVDRQTLPRLGERVLFPSNVDSEQDNRNRQDLDSHPSFVAYRPTETGMSVSRARSKCTPLSSDSGGFLSREDTSKGCLLKTLVL